MANIVLARRRLVLGLPVVAAVVAAIVSLLVPEIYRATTTFSPESSDSGTPVPAGLAGIASQFGIGLGGEGAESPQFYASLLRSRTIRDRVLTTPFPDPRSSVSGGSASLLDLLEVEGETEALRIEKGRIRLNGMVQVSVNEQTGIVTVSVESRYPEISASVANLLVELLSEFNLMRRQSSARESRHFAQERVAAAEEELALTERELREFLERNRQWEASPELRFQHDRLQRQVAIRTEIYTSLRRQYEESRIAEVNDTPMITVIDEADVPQQRARPRRTLNVLLSFALGGVVALFLAFTGAFLDHAAKEDRAAMEELRAHLRRMTSGILRRPRKA